MAAIAVVLGLALGAGAALALLEAALRIRPELFSRRFQTVAFSRYDSLPGGIYVGDGELKMLFMRPDAELRAGFNGYFWTHRTDHRGFRNPPGREPPEVVLLGDSMIYGHGVDEEVTTAHFLDREHGRATYNMSRQGDGLYQHYVLTRLYLDELQPETVVLFTFLNDLEDVEKARSADELAHRPELERDDWGEVRRRVERLQHARPGALAAAWYRLHVARVLLHWSRGLDAWLDRAELTATAEAAAGDETPARGPRGQPFLDPLLDARRFRPLAGYYRAVLPRLAALCRERGARLVVVNLHLEKTRRPTRHRRAQRRLRQLVEPLARRHAALFLDTAELFADCEPCYLVNDGHLSELGHRRLAAFLDTALEQSP